MSIEIKGLNNLIQRFTELENIDITNVVREVAEDVNNQVKSACSWAPKAARHIKVCEIKKYTPYTCFAKVGLRQSDSPFEEWKNLWFHEYGYNLVYFGNPTNKFISMHTMWFENAVQGAKKTAQKNLRAKIKQKMKV